MGRNKIELKDGKILLNNEPFFLYSGEIHYFRIPKDKWVDRLRKARETGLNTISTYIPWAWHEHEEGQFDFTGKTSPQKDLIYFIKLVKNAGFNLIARIGPTSNAEIKGEGTPPWFLENYQEARAKNRKGSNVPHEAMVSYMHPVFQERVSGWYSKILPIIHKNSFTKGGPVIMVQLDNEIGMMNWVMGDADYNKATTEMYGEYLKALYGGELSALNDRYYTNHTSFKEIPQPKGDVDEEGVRRCWDWVHFYRDFYARYYNSLSKRAKGAKIDLPFVANIPMFWDYNICARGNQGLMTVLQYRDFIKYTPHIIFGGAYQMRNLNFENFHDAILMTEGLNMIGDKTAPRVCLEAQVGGMNDRPRIYPNDINLLMRYSIGHGLNGLNAYMFCGGLNPPGLGFRGTYHEWQAPIDSKGKKNSKIKPMEDVGDLVKTFGSQIADTKKNYDFAMGLYAPYYETGYLKGSVIDQMALARDNFFFDGIARLLMINGYNYNLVDIERAKIRDLQEIPAMWVFSMDYMDQATQLKLAEYVKRGGTLIMNPTAPNKNMGLLREESLLKEFDVSIGETVNDNLVFVTGKDYLIEGDIKVFESKKRRVVARTRDRKPCGILKKIKKGKLLLLGFAVKHTLDYQIGLIDHFMQILNLPRCIKTSVNDVHAVMRSNKKYGFLFVSNFNDEPHEVTLNFRIPGLNKSATIPQENKLLMPNRSSYVLPLNVPVSRRAKIRYSTAEILKASCTDRELRLALHGSAGGHCEILIEIRKPYSVSLDGSEINFKHKDGILKLSFPLTGKKQSLVII
ncbi:MAG: beta-galactosidase [Candidatus Omnitrophica bacterium]|nr:beta-galactosidase [Candidatus Omnitrophota bacterium]